MVLRSVASVIFLAPAVIVCLSGGTPVSAKSYRQRRDGQPAPTGHASGAHTAALTRTRTAPARGSKQACTSPRTHWPHAPSRSHTTLARTPARGRHLRFEHVGGFIEDDIDVVLVLLPLDLHGYRARHGSHAVEERSKAADSKTSWRRDWFLSLRKEERAKGAEIVGLRPSALSLSHGEDLSAPGSRRPNARQVSAAGRCTFSRFCVRAPCLHSSPISLPVPETFSACSEVTGRTLRARAKPPPRAQNVRVRAAESADDVCSGFVTCLTPSRCIAAASAASAVRPAHASLRAAGNEGAASSGGLFSKIKNALGGGGKPDKPENLDGLSPPPARDSPQ